MITEQVLIDVGQLVDREWQCLKCGSCCKMVNCKLLTNDNLCPIYENRPELCKTENFKITDYERAKACYMLKEFIDKTREQK